MVAASWTRHCHAGDGAPKIPTPGSVSLPSPEMKGRRLNAIGGSVPNPLNMPPDCRFMPRCPPNGCLLDYAADSDTGEGDLQPVGFTRRRKIDQHQHVGGNRPSSGNRFERRFARSEESRTYYPSRTGLFDQRFIWSKLSMMSRSKSARAVRSRLGIRLRKILARSLNHTLGEAAIRPNPV